MSLIRWDPFTGTDDLLARMPSLLGRWPRNFELTGKNGAEWSPSVDISETAAEYLIRADLPAVKKEDIRITVDEGLLTISGERRQQSEEKSEKMHRIEALYGRFSRTFSLPDNADLQNIRAESREGVTTIHVAKSKAAPKAPTEIKVQ